MLLDSLKFWPKNSVITFFYAFLRSILEYGSIIWDPHTAANDSLQLERVQRTFLRFGSYIIDITLSLHRYTSVANHLNLDSLVDRKQMLGMKFLSGLLSNTKDPLVTLVTYRFYISMFRNILAVHLYPFISLIQK